VFRSESFSIDQLDGACSVLWSTLPAALFQSGAVVRSTINAIYLAGWLPSEGARSQVFGIELLLLVTLTHWLCVMLAHPRVQKGYTRTTSSYNYQCGIFLWKEVRSYRTARKPQSHDEYIHSFIHSLLLGNSCVFGHLTGSLYSLAREKRLASRYLCPPLPRFRTE
jgi:hypothetical protein